MNPSKTVESMWNIKSVCTDSAGMRSSIRNTTKNESKELERSLYEILTVTLMLLCFVYLCLVGSVGGASHACFYDCLIAYKDQDCRWGSFSFGFI